MQYLIVDGMLSGTGVRDAVEGGYVSLSSLALSESLKEDLNLWLKEYENEHYSSYSDSSRIIELDEQGLRLAKQLKAELNECKIGYYSAALNKSMLI